MMRLALLLLLLCSFGASAQEGTQMHPYLESKYYASLGWFKPQQGLSLGLDASIDPPELGPAPYVDFSQKFGMTSTDDSFSAEIGWRFGTKWQLRGQYFRVDNDSRATLEETIEWGDVEYTAGTTVAAGTDMQITRLFFGRTFRSNEKREFGLGVGGHILDLEAFISGEAVLDGNNLGFRKERASISQPLPNIGAWYMHAFDQNWAAYLRFDWLAANVDTYDGRIINASASVGYVIGDHVGLALAYNFFEIDLGVDDSSWRGRAKIRFDGPSLAITGYW